MRLFLLMALLLSATHAQDPAAPITSIGEFSNMVSDGEHQSGYTVELFRQGDTVFGLFLAASGLIGDTPAGLLENVHFDNGKLTFQAKLTTGIVMLGGGKSEPSRDFFEFEGALRGRTLAGQLKRTDRGRHEIYPTSSQAIHLKRRKPATDLPRTYGDWMKQTSEILKVRGPQW